jgi:hypothetical protein
MWETEAIVRTGLRNLINDPNLLGAFVSKKRNTFLNNWEKSKSFTPPIA